jgi:DNA-directed RNA polymerase sigma subunit (sigma70/sigma32)
LSEIECSVIRLRFGISGVPFASIAEVALRLQLSEASVRSIEKRALEIVSRSWRELLEAA